MYYSYRITINYNNYIFHGEFGRALMIYFHANIVLSLAVIRSNDCADSTLNFAAHKNLLLGQDYLIGHFLWLVDQ